MLYKLDVIRRRFGTFLRNATIAESFQPQNVMIKQSRNRFGIGSDMLDGDPVTAQTGYHADAACRRPTFRAW